MSCPKPVELSRALVVGIDDQLRAHLDICLQCSSEIEAHAAVVGETHYLPVVEPTHEHARDVRTALLGAVRSPVPNLRPRFIWGFAAAGALAAAAVFAFVVLRKPEAPAQTAASPIYRGTILPHEGAALLRVGSAPDEIVRLVNGTVSVEVAKLEPGERFRVVTGDAEVEVRGTAFDVSVDRDHLKGVRVIHGHVEIRAQGAAPKLLAAGERWHVELARAETLPVEPEPAAVAVAEPAIDPVEAVPATESSAVAIEPARPAKPSPTRTTTRAKHHHVAAPAKAPAETPAPAAPAKTPQALSAKPTQAPSAPARQKRPIELLFDEGWATLAGGDATAAAAIFERAAQPAPKDPLAEDAWFWRASALARAKSSAAAGALDSFLSRYASSPRVGEASAMLGWLIIDSDLDRAEKLFNAATKDRVASVRASASKGLAAIEQRRKRQR